MAELTEKQVLEIVRGYSNTKELARDRGYSVRQIQNHRQNLARNRVDRKAKTKKRTNRENREYVERLKVEFGYEVLNKNLIMIVIE